MLDKKRDFKNLSNMYKLRFIPISMRKTTLLRIDITVCRNIKNLKFWQNLDVFLFFILLSPCNNFFIKK